MKLRRQYLLMLGLNAAICAYWVYYRSVLNIQILPYPHFLVDYSLGFTKRALIGEIFSFWYPRVPISVVFVSATVMLAVAILLYLLLFRRDFGFSGRSLPLLVLIAGSPFFFKNFFYNLGYFDALGCIVAIVALLLPVNRLYPALLALGSVLLVLIHHLLFLLYVPTIGVICVLRYLVVTRRYNFERLIYLGTCAVLVIGAFAIVLFHGTPHVPQAVFLAHMKARALDPFSTNFVHVWYSTPREEFRATLKKLPRNMLAIPAYVLVFLAHWPLIRLYRGRLRAIAGKADYRFAIAGLAVIAAGYFCIFFMVFDYSRWVSSWAVCMVLMLHAIMRLPSAQAGEFPARHGRDQTNAFAWLVTIIPRIGTVSPF